MDLFMIRNVECDGGMSVLYRVLSTLAGDGRIALRNVRRRRL
jgi:hypothetical protein